MIQRYALVLVCLLFCSGAATSQVVINEFHITPPAPLLQWVELYNTSDTPFSFEGCKVGNHRFERDMPAVTLGGGRFAIVVTDTAAFLETYSVPSGTLLIQVPTYPALNRASAGGVVLRGADDAVIDTIGYDPRWGIAERSLERRDVFAPASSAENLGASVDPDGFTPGRLNSIALLDRDAAASSLIFDGAEKVLIATIVNRGRQTLSGGTARLFHDVNNNGRAEANELVEQISGLTLPAGDSIEVDFDRPEELSGTLPFIVVADFAGDQRPANDTVAASIFLSPLGTSLLINEFMYSPLENGGEFCEIFNAADQPINMRDWVLHRRAGSTGRADSFVVQQDFIIQPGAYGVLTWDTTFFNIYPDLVDDERVHFRRVSFNFASSGDQAVLRDPARTMIDSLEYLDNWHSLPTAARRGRSLEKISPLLPSVERNSWTSSSDPTGGTPGRVNSVAVELPDEGTLTATPNPFSLSGASGLCIIRYSLPYAQARVTISIFDGRGVPVKSLFNAEFSSAEGFVQWDGTNSNGAQLPVGAYVCFLEAVDFATGEHINKKILIAIRP